MPNLVYDLGCLLLGDECFNGYFASDEGNGIGDMVRLQEPINGLHKLTESGFLLPRGIRDGLKFWEGYGNVVFPKVN